MKKLHWYDLISVNLFWLALNIRNFSIGNTIMPYLIAGFVVESIEHDGLRPAHYCDAGTAGFRAAQ
jgi:hypothetical protein